MSLVEWQQNRFEKQTHSNRKRNTHIHTHRHTHAKAHSLCILNHWRAQFCVHLKSLSIYVVSYFVIVLMTEWAARLFVRVAFFWYNYQSHRQPECAIWRISCELCQIRCEMCVMIVALSQSVAKRCRVWKFMPTPWMNVIFMQNSSCSPVCDNLIVIFRICESQSLPHGAAQKSKWSAIHSIEWQIIVYF